MLRVILSFILMLFLTACGEPRYNFDVKGADEFVMDSYRIRQGKFAILEMEGIPTCPMPADAFCEYQDCISEDDVLLIALWHPTRGDLSNAVQGISGAVGYRVRHGEILLPQLGPIQCIGLTLAEARLKIQQMYDSQLSNIEVFIEYRERYGRVVELIGMVGQCTIPVDGKMRLFDVLCKASVPMNANFFMSYVMRGGHALPVDMYKLIHDGDMCQNIVMKAGDKIFIADPMDSKVMLMGEVGSPTIICLPRGYISLREAIVSAGGIPYSGDKGCIQVIRGNIVCPKVYLLNWNHVITLPNHSLLLMPGDTVYVSEKPITQWNRFLEQLLPTMGGVNAVHSTVNIIGY